MISADVVKFCLRWALMLAVGTPALVLPLVPWVLSIGEIFDLSSRVEPGSSSGGFFLGVADFALLGSVAAGIAYWAFRKFHDKFSRTQFHFIFATIVTVVGWVFYIVQVYVRGDSQNSLAELLEIGGSLILLTIIINWYFKSARENLDLL